MTIITESTTIAELGAIVCEALRNEGIDALLSGGAVTRGEGKEGEYEQFVSTLKARQ